MLLNHRRIADLLRLGVVEGAKLAQINQTSLDITLGGTVLVEDKVGCLHGSSLAVSPSRGDALHMHSEPCDAVMGYLLEPGQFILTHSREIFNLPNDVSAEYKLKSSLARIGLEHLNAGWCDPGWHGSALTLELKNVTQHHTIWLREGDRIGQVVFFRHEPVDAACSYAATGRYNNDKLVSGAKAGRST